MGRAPCCDKDKVKKGPWSPEEDAKLKAYIDTYGTGNNWIALPQKIGLMRCGKSCRLRWLNYLRPNIKHGGFSEEEDSIICSLYISIGSRWSIIAAQLPGRTDNDIKNYWNTRLKKKLLGRRKTSHINRPTADPKDSDGVDDNFLSNSALERLELHMQLQGLQNPFSHFNNPAPWPKLNPLQEKMIRTLQSFNDNSNLLMQPIHYPGQGLNVEFNEPKMDELENSLPIAFNSGTTNIIPDSAIVPKSDTQIVMMNSATRTISTFQAQIDDDFVNNKSAEFGEYDCLKEMEGSKDNMIWWSDDFDPNSASSISWDTTNCVLHQSDDVVYQDFGLGYDMPR